MWNYFNFLLPLPSRFDVSHVSNQSCTYSYCTYELKLCLPLVNNPFFCIIIWSTYPFCQSRLLNYALFRERLHFLKRIHEQRQNLLQTIHLCFPFFCKKNRNSVETPQQICYKKVNAIFRENNLPFIWWKRAEILKVNHKKKKTLQLSFPIA